MWYLQPRSSTHSINHTTCVQPSSHPGNLLWDVPCWYLQYNIVVSIFGCTLLVWILSRRNFVWAKLFRFATTIRQLQLEQRFERLDLFKHFSGYAPMKNVLCYCQQGKRGYDWILVYPPSRWTPLCALNLMIMGWFLGKQWGIQDWRCSKIDNPMSIIHYL